MIKENDRTGNGTLFEGIVSIRTLIEVMGSGSDNDRKIKKVLVSTKRSLEKKSEFVWLNARASEFGFTVETVGEDLIDSISVGSSHGGIVAEVTERQIPILQADSIPNGKFYVMLDGVEDPYNFGYAIRSLYSAGVDGIIIPPRNWMSASGIVSRASAGASELIDMYCADSHSVAQIMKSAGYRIVCADLRNSVSIFDASLSYPLLLIVGGEKRGISRAVLNLSDINVKISYGRQFDASLSAASAATVAAFEIYRKNR